MARVDAATPEEWKAHAMRVITRVAKKQPYFTTDDLWAAGLRPAPNNSALGPALRRAASYGIISVTPAARKAERPERHGTFVPIWKSELITHHGSEPCPMCGMTQETE
jgi:hypothetical protein